MTVERLAQANWKTLPPSGEGRRPLVNFAAGLTLPVPKDTEAAFLPVADNSGLSTERRQRARPVCRLKSGELAADCVATC
jgi:hypothetical protein